MGPSIFRHESPNSTKAISNFRFVHACIACLIENYNFIFEVFNENF